ncbi:MAG: 16S rRNA (guanine(527)-N(7))-methyltransferase RsmG [Acidaminococcales bacterium]|nr:16S rRNA (guanine(527)-N(7))-methyltransferase RsmG [Acidaminococcales bacterium]
MFKKIVEAAAAQSGIALDAGQLAQFSLYLELLAQANEKMNLTAISGPEEIAVKHFIDSLTVYDAKYFPAGALVCDVGTGAGFPGLPLKIFRPDLKVALLDATAKKLAFLDRLIAALQLTGVGTCHIRAEDAGRSPRWRERYDVVTARAVAPFKVLCEYCLPLVKVGGVFAAMRARRAREESAEAENAAMLLGGRTENIKEARLPGRPDVRAIIYLRKIKPTPPLYPRKAGRMGKGPPL